jgi:GTPase
MERSYLTKERTGSGELRKHAILVGVLGKQGSRQAAQNSLDELYQLACSAGVFPVAVFFQEMEVPDSAFFIGKGKASEIRDFIGEKDISLALVDDDLTPCQQRNLEDLWNCRVLDRTVLVLDIFAQRAKTSEGKLQVELAQLNYMLPRLSGKGVQLSRLGGGIGTRGPGETKLETDRRRIRRRISLLRKELENVRQRRELQRIPRKAIPAQTVALVGYTNAGKSTLFQALCRTSTLVSDKMFSTLDPTIRGMDLPDGRRILIADTVGFLNKLPHHLVAAFRATLEEVTEADLLLHVIDSSSANPFDQIRQVRQILDDLNCGEKRQLYLFNKIDRLSSQALEDLRRAAHSLPRTIEISAIKETGLEQLFEAIAEQLPDPRVRILIRLPYSESSLRSLVHDRGRILQEEFLPEGILLEALVDKELQSRLSSFRWKQESSVSSSLSV